MEVVVVNSDLLARIAESRIEEGEDRSRLLRSKLCPTLAGAVGNIKRGGGWAERRLSAKLPLASLLSRMGSGERTFTTLRIRLI